MSLRIHLPGLPWTQFNSKYSICAYTHSKMINLCKMLMRHTDIEVVLYGGPNNTAPCTKYVEVISQTEQEKWFGKWSNQKLFPNISWDERHESWTTMNKRVIGAMADADPRDLLGIIAGTCQAQIANANPAMIACEYSVGYRGVFTKYRCFESSAWRHFIQGVSGEENGRWYDATINPYFDRTDFPNHNKGDGDYLLFIGRLVSRKGVSVAVDIAKQAGMKIKIAGPGALEVLPGMVRSDELTVFGKHIEFMGSVGPQQRSELMAGAKAVLMPTYFLEPGGNVCGEALMSGTPVIAPDWGVMSEAVINDFNGFKFQNIPEAVAAVKRCSDFDNEAIRYHAYHNWSLEATAPKYLRWFSNLSALWTTNWDGSPVNPPDKILSKTPKAGK